MKKIVFSQHAKDQVADRGATEDEVINAIEDGEKMPAKRGRLSFRKNYPYGKIWKGKRYEMKQVVPIVVDEGNMLVVVTVYVYFFGG